MFLGSLPVTCPPPPAQLGSQSKLAISQTLHHSTREKVGGVTNEGEDTGSALGVQANHPVAEHGEE